MPGRGKERGTHARYGEVHHPHAGVHNALVEDGSIGQRMQAILENLQPEAAYLCHVEGKRGGYLVANLEEASELVTKIEPFFLQMGAEIETFPVLNANELGAGLQSLGQTS